MTSPKPAAAVDLDALKCAVDRSACTDANQWAYSDFTADFSPDVIRALIAELEQLRTDANSYRVIRTLVEHDEQLRVRFYQVLAMAEAEAKSRKVPSPPEAVKP